jgi:hypothetical protein
VKILPYTSINYRAAQREQTHDRRNDASILQANRYRNAKENKGNHYQEIQSDIT